MMIIAKDLISASLHALIRLCIENWSPCIKPMQSLLALPHVSPVLQYTLVTSSLCLAHLL
jgi:hypothetical protein